MRLDSIILGLRKLGNYLLALSPPLERACDRARASLSQLFIEPLGGLVRRRPGFARRVRAARDVFRHFWWSDYSKDRVDWSRVPPEGAPILRVVLAAALLLCLLLPLALVFPVPPLPVGAVPKAHGPVAVWSVWLWLAVLSLAWGCLLAGAARCNRPVVLLASILYLYYMGVASAGLPRAAANLLVPLAALAASFVSERMLRTGPAPDVARGLLSCILVGVVSGVALVALTPLKGIVPGKHPLFGALLGIPLGLFAFGSGISFFRRVAISPSRRYDPHAAIPLQLAAWLLGGMTLFFLGSLAARGGAAVPANAVIDFLTVWAGYLWPAYYFIGVGIILKVLKSTKVLSYAAQEVLPSRVFAPACAVLFAAGALFLWAPAVFDASALPWPAPIVAAAAAIYRSAASWLWSNPLRSTAALWLRWIFLFDLLALLWCLAARRLSMRILSSLLFQTLLAWFLITEYLIQFHGFACTGSRTAASYLIFSIWLLWLLYSNGVKISLGSSAWWPASGRLALFGAAMLILMLAVHARATIRDELARNEVFLALFLGVIDVGVPYALFVYADRRLGRLPVPLHLLFGAFCFGAALTMPLAALDKVVDAEGSFAALRSGLDTRFQAVLSGVVAPGTLLRLPPWWIALRGVIALVALAALAMALSRRAASRREGRAVLILALFASAVGLASFSKSSVFTELPMVSPRWTLLFAPLRQSLYLDANVVAQYLAYALPALAMGLVLTGTGGMTFLRQLVGFASAYGLHLAAALAWPWHEAWLRSTGMLATAGLAGLGLAMILFRTGRTRVEEAVGQADTEAAGGPRLDTMPVVGARSARALACAGAVVLGLLAFFQVVSGRLVLRSIPGFTRALPLPAAWEPSPNTPTSVNASFIRGSISLIRPLLLVTVHSGIPGSATAFLDRMAEEMAGTVRAFSAVRRESWDGAYPGALALDFSFEQVFSGGRSGPFMGTTVLLPVGRGEFLTITLVDSCDSWQARRWDLVRTAAAMR